MFLDKLGLAQYTAAFEKSGFENHRAIHKLCQQDLDDIEKFSGDKILPGHRKILVNAATSLQVPSPAQCVIASSVGTWLSCPSLQWLAGSLHLDVLDPSLISKTAN